MSVLRRLKDIVIFKDRHYNSFPSIVKLPDGRLLMAFRQAPDRRTVYNSITHIDPASAAVSLASPDGLVWDGEPTVVYDDYFCGIQDPCLNVLSDGTLFGTFFMWKVGDLEDLTDRNRYPLTVMERWGARLNGVYSIRSKDGGRTWDLPIRIEAAHSHACLRGNCAELPDGAILAPLYGSVSGASNVSIARTVDRGQTWSIIAGIQGADGHHFHEPNLYRTPRGRLVAFIRTRKRAIAPGEERYASPLYTAESSDNGVTWSRPVRHEIYSPSPFHVLPLADGRVLVTYGYRLPPYGIRALVLDAECTRIDPEQQIVLREDAGGADIGYTSSVQLEGGRILVTYYYYDEPDGYRYIAGTLCEIAT